MIVTEVRESTSRIAIWLAYIRVGKSTMESNLQTIRFTPILLHLYIRVTDIRYATPPSTSILYEKTEGPQRPDIFHLRRPPASTILQNCLNGEVGPIHAMQALFSTSQVSNTVFSK